MLTDVLLTSPGGATLVLRSIFEASTVMVDIHCHILPGIDDGSQAMEESLEMAESAIADGISHVVATPHSSSHHVFDYVEVRRLRDDLQARLGDRLQLATGCDFHVNAENLDLLRADAPRFCINQKNYLLVEFNEFSIPPPIDQALHSIQLSGLRPIITHPERNSILRTQPDRLRKWIRTGCFGQVTGGSLLGSFGPAAQKEAMDWIDEGLIHFIASDAHNTRMRPLKLRPAYQIVAEEFGEEKAVALFQDNPLAAFEGRDLPHVPDLDEPEETHERPRKRFFFF